MSNIIIIHGTKGSPEGNWFMWLKEELEKEGHNVFVPRFPTPEGQSLESWMEVFEDYRQYLDEDSILVGHSTGATFILSVLETLDKPIKSAYLASGFTWFERNDPELEEVYNLNSLFSDREFNWEKIRSNCRSFHVLHGDNDPFLEIEIGRDLAKNLGVECIEIENGGHLNSESGYDEFPLLLEMIKEELK